MLNQLRADFYRLFRSPVFYVCMAVIAAFAGLGVLGTMLMANQLEAAGQDAGVNAYDFFFSSFGSGEMAVLLVCILAGVFITAEYVNGTFKIALAKGRGRGAAYLSKLAAVSFTSAVYLLLYQLLTLLLSAAAFGWGREIGVAEVARMAGHTGLALLIYIAAGALMTMLAFVVRSNAAAVSIGIIGVLSIDMVFYVINEIIGGNADIARYWLLNALEPLEAAALASGEAARALILSAVYFVITTAIGIFAFRRRDIK